MFSIPLENVGNKVVEIRFIFVISYMTLLLHVKKNFYIIVRRLGWVGVGFNEIEKKSVYFPVFSRASYTYCLAYISLE